MMGFIPEGSLAGKMWGTVSESLADLQKGISSLTAQEDEEEETAVTTTQKQEGVDQRYAALDARAQSGDVNFEDFLDMGRTFAKMGDNVGSLPGQLSAKEVLETREKFAKHEKIVEIMLEDERLDPQLLIDDLKAGGSTPGPRIQRLASGSGQTEADVGLFIMQFEAMRESTRRIAAGEDPDEVEQSMAALPGSNRAARRAKKAKAKKKAKQ